MTERKYKIYTRGGDAGKTHLGNGKVVKKNDLQVDAYGCVDELNSSLGLLVAQMRTMPLATGMPAVDDDCREIYDVQRFLFGIGAWMAGVKAPKHLPGAEDVTHLENLIDACEDLVNRPFTCFLLPDGCVAGAQAHVTRTVCRRAERRLLDLLDARGVSEEDAPHAYKYLNRLSDFLFALSKKLNFLANVEEIKL